MCAKNLSALLVCNFVLIIVMMSAVFAYLVYQLSSKQYDAYLEHRSRLWSQYLSLLTTELIFLIENST